MDHSSHFSQREGIPYNAAHVAESLLSGVFDHGAQSLVGLRTETAADRIAELAQWRQAGQLARFGYWSWTADVPGEWGTGRSNYSPEGAAIFGLTPNDLAMGTVPFCERIVHPADGERVRLFCEHMNDRRDRTYSVEYRIALPSGDVRDVLEFAENSYDAAGRIVSTTGTIQDITGRNRLEKKLREAHALDLLGEVAGGVAHNCNNLLAVILGNAQLLADELKDHELDLVPLVRLRRIISAGRDGADFVDRLLTYTRRQVLVAQEVNINGLIAGLLSRLVSIVGKDIVIETDYDRRLWPAWVHPGFLENAILELAINAIDALPSGGRICIQTSNVSFDRVNASQDRVPGVMIKIVDSGTGMPPDVVARALEPFFTTKDVRQGLGLSMVSGFISQSGGKMEIDSRSGAGTEVRLYLPRAEGQSAIGARLM